MLCESHQPYYADVIFLISFVVFRSVWFDVLRSCHNMFSFLLTVVILKLLELENVLIMNF